MDNVDERDFRSYGEEPISEKSEIIKTPKRKRRKRKYKKGPLYVIAGLAGVLFLFSLFFFLPIPLGNIVLNGGKAVSAEDVLFEGQIKEPVNVFQISTSDLEERLRHDLRIKTVQVNRRFPLTVEVNIVEREAVAIIQTEYGYADIDDAGMIIGMAPLLESFDIPLITGKKPDSVLLYEVLSDGDIEKALLFITALDDGTRKSVSEINVGNADNLAVYTRDGISVHLGSGENLKEQAVLTSNMLRDVRARNIAVEYLDANLTAPFIKLRK